MMLIRSFFALLICESACFGAIRFVFDGDSLMASNHNTLSCWQFYLTNSYFSGTPQTNVATGGLPLIDLFNRFSTNTAQMKPSEGETVVLSFTGGAVDVFAGTGWPIIIPRWTNYCFVARSNGFKIVYLTVPYSTQYDASVTSNALALNSYTTKTNSGCVDLIIDYASFFTPSMWSNSAWSYDGRHPTVAGDIFIATNWENAVQSYLSSPIMNASQFNVGTLRMAP